MITQRPKGTQDWYGDNMYKRTVIEEKARIFFARLDAISFNFSILSLISLNLSLHLLDATKPP